MIVLHGFWVNLEFYLLLLNVSVRKSEFQEASARMPNKLLFFELVKEESKMRDYVYVPIHSSDVEDKLKRRNKQIKIYFYNQNEKKIKKISRTNCT